MNEKVGFLNLYSPQDSRQWFRPENIADFPPALIFVYAPGSQTIPYGNQTFIDFTGKSLQDLKGSKTAPESFRAPPGSLEARQDSTFQPCR